MKSCLIDGVVGSARLETMYKAFAHLSLIGRHLANSVADMHDSPWFESAVEPIEMTIINYSYEILGVFSRDSRYVSITCNQSTICHAFKSAETTDLGGQCSIHISIHAKGTINDKFGMSFRFIFYHHLI